MKRYFFFANLAIFLLVSCASRPARIPTALPNVMDSKLGVGSTMNSDKDGMTILYVPAGEFVMGGKAEDALVECQKFRSDCLLEWFKDEEPPHKVALDAFWIDQTEITNTMYAKCVQDGACNPPSSKISYTRDSYYGDAQFDNYPVIYISFEDANAYCSWANRRLLTEAEWEKAARGTDERIYPWGNDAPNKSLLNYEDAIGDTIQVGIYPNGASPYGALDMGGNVWEWVTDWYSETYYTSSPVSNPLGPDSGQYRALRGGAWYSIGVLVRSAVRNWDAPSAATDFIGFRCAMEATT